MMFKVTSKVKPQNYDLNSLMEGLPNQENCYKRHHDAHSEPYTGLDSMLTAMAQDWIVHDEVVVECTLCFKQETSVYHFELWREGQHRNMCVIANPAVERLIRNLGLRCVQMEMYRQ